MATVMPSGNPRVYQSDMTATRSRAGGWEITAYRHGSSRAIRTVLYQDYSKRDALRLMADALNGPHSHRGMGGYGYCVDCGARA